MTSDIKELQVNEDQMPQSIDEEAEHEELIREKIKTVLESREIDEEQAAMIKAAEDEKQETLDKIKTVLNAKETELEQAAEEIAPEFDYVAAAEEIEAEEAAAEISTLYGIDMFRAMYEEEQKTKPLPSALVSPSVYPKPKYNAKTAVGRYFLKDNNRKVMGIWLIMFVILIAGYAIDYAVPESVTVSYRTMKKVRKEVVETRCKTVGDLREELIRNGYKIEENDAMIPTDDAVIKNGMLVQIMKATEVTAKIAGNKQTILMIPGTVEDVLAYNNITYDNDDEIKPALNKKVGLDTKIVVKEVHYKTKEKQEKVEATNKVILDPKLTSGVQEKIEGNDGEGIFIYKYKYVNGKKAGTDKEVKEWIVEPHDNTLRLGTSATGNRGEFIVTRTFIANCTAYTARPGARGSLGQPVHLGTCAVDPKFVPYRSQMWIEGYGYAFANDCGGAVKRNVVDLYMNTNSACIQWGRRNKTAYILQPVK